MKPGKQIKFFKNGKLMQAVVLSVDSNVNARMWAVDCSNPDVDYFVLQSECL